MELKTQEAVEAVAETAQHQALLATLVYVALAL
jgi:hypothetical protein